jgi:hypothetical protein
MLLVCLLLRLPGVFKASSFYDMLERLWAAMFDLLLKLSNMFKDRRWALRRGGGRRVNDRSRLTLCMRASRRACCW